MKHDAQTDPAMRPPADALERTPCANMARAPQRVELKEIESCLSLHPGVRDCAVIAREHECDTQLVAFYVPSKWEGQSRWLAADTIQAHLRRFLPEPMIPRVLLPLETIPLQPDGKKDRNALLVLAAGQEMPERPCILRTEETERAVAASSSQPGSMNLSALLRREVAELLGLAVGDLPSDQVLSTLGFSSIDAISLKSKLEQEFGGEVPASTVKVYQTLEQLESALAPLIFPNGAPEMESSKSGPVDLQPVWAPKPEERFAQFLLTDIQESFYLGRKMGNGDRVGCHIYFEMEREAIDIYRLNAAWNRMVRRHEMLRAVFLPQGGQRIQEETPPYRFRVMDLRRCDAPAQKTNLDRVREEMSHRLYEPEQWPLFDIRVTILPTRRVIHFSIDELIVDALSVDVLLREWQQCYDQPDTEFQPLELSFRDYVLAMKAFSGSARAQKDLDYWRGKLATMPSGPRLPGVPIDGGGEGRRHRCTRLEQTLSAQHWSALKKRAERFDVSPTALVLSLFVEALRAHSSQPGFSLILTFFNRVPIHPQVSQIVGPCISTTLFVADAPPSKNLGERACATQHQIWEDLNHNSVSGIRALRELKRENTQLRDVKLPVVFTSLIGARTGSSPALMRDISFAVTQTPQVWLDHQVRELDGELVFSWDVAHDLFEPGSIDALFACYCGFLEAATAESFLLDDSWQNALRPASPLPLTDQQRAYLFGRTPHGGQRASSIYMEFEVAELNRDRLEEAWNKLIRAHPMLAATIKADGTQQVLQPPPRYGVSVQDVDGNSEEVRDSLARIERQMMDRMCPPGEWPFFELRVSRLAQAIARVHLCIDMLIADPPSIDYLAQELFRLYAEPEAAAKTPAHQFREYCQRLGESSDRGQPDDYWENKFTAIPPAPRLPARDGVAGGKTRRISGKLTGWKRLKAKAAQLKVPPAMVLLAAYAEVLWTGTQRQPFTLVMPCWSEARDVVGDFTALAWLPVRDLSGTFEDRVRQYERQIQADLAHGTAKALQALRRVSRKLGKPLNFPVVFTDLNPRPLIFPAGVRLSHSRSQTAQVQLDNLSTDEGDILGLHWDVVEGPYVDGSIEEIFAQYEAILSQLAEDDALWRKEVM